MKFVTMAVFLLSLSAHSDSLDAETAPPDTTTFQSPAGFVRVQFVPTQSMQADSASNQDGYVKYDLVFTDKRGKVLGHAAFADVYGWSLGGGRPLTPSDLFPRFTWNPKEDAVLLPEENWERAPGPPVRKAVNLNRKYPWKETQVRMENERWIDAFSLVGEKSDECEHSVVIFDARNGKTKTLIEGKGFTAYTIGEFHKPYQLQIESRLGNCLQPGDEAKFTAECIQLDIRNWKKDKKGCH